MIYSFVTQLNSNAFFAHALRERVEIAKLEDYLKKKLKLINW